MMQVLIAGAGIGGLSLALALAKHGISSRIFEARDLPPREGAGIQLGPNATRLLFDLGLADTLEKLAVAPGCIIVNDGLSGRELTRLPLGNWIAQRHGAPYWVIHRADLYDALWETASRSPLIDIMVGRTLAGLHENRHDGLIDVSFHEGGTASGHVLVGADGLWSNARQHINPDATLKFTGAIAARAVVPRMHIPARFAQMATGVWLAPSAHVVHYPVRHGEHVAVIAIAQDAEATVGWNSAIDCDSVTKRFSNLTAELVDFLAAVPQWQQWALYRAEQTPRWSNGRAVLIGDAAHPIMPFLAQGGAMAIEDGYELGDYLAKFGLTDLVAALETFTRHRQKRVAKVQAASVGNGQAYHLNGLAALTRNAVLQALPGSLFMRRYDWIYGYTGP